MKQTPDASSLSQGLGLLSFASILRYPEICTIASVAERLSHFRLYLYFRTLRMINILSRVSGFHQLIHQCNSTLGD